MWYNFQEYGIGAPRKVLYYTLFDVCFHGEPFRQRLDFLDSYSAFGQTHEDETVGLTGNHGGFARKIQHGMDDSTWQWTHRIRSCYLRSGSSNIAICQT